MAKKIRFPLKMKDGAEVRTLDELRENFDLESVLGYFTDGKLVTWLSDRYYDEKAEAVSALSADMPDLNAKLCEILEVEYQAEEDETDMELIARRREKLKILSSVTDDSEILNNIDLVAMDQDELFDILDEKSDKVYLYGDKFSIPSGARNVQYIGVNNPLVVLDKDKYGSDYEELGILFSKVRFEDGINKNGEELFLAGKYKEAFHIIEKEAFEGNARAMYIMSVYYNEGYNTVKINYKIRDKWFEKAYALKYPLSIYGYANYCLKNKSYEQITMFSQVLNDITSMAENNDVFAQNILGDMYFYGQDVAKDFVEAVKWYQKAAENGYAMGEDRLGIMFEYGNGIKQDYNRAFELYKKSAEKGCAQGQNDLGRAYLNGISVSRDDSRAVEFFRRASEQGLPSGHRCLGDMYVATNRAKAIELYKKAVAEGDYIAYGGLRLMGVSL